MESSGANQQLPLCCFFVKGVKVGSAPKPPKEKQKVYGGAFVKSTTLEECAYHICRQT
jgi:hypothetical protein